MKFKVKSKTLLLALCGLVLVGCDGTDTEPIGVNSVISALRTGFTVTGSVEIQVSYYEDINYTVPYETTLATTTTYTFTLIYQNDDDYTGVDRRFYQVEDGESEYLFGENSFDLDGYVGIRYLDYDNTIQTTYGVDDDGELAIYALNGLMNPFELVQRNDFKSQSDGTFELSTTKASVFYGALFSVLDDYYDSVSFETANFAFTETSLTSAHFESYNLDTTTATTLSSEGYVNVYPRYNYTADLYFSDIGTSSAEDVIKVEEEKEENAPLAQALKLMGDSKGFTYRRRSTPYVNRTYANRDEVVIVYYSHDGKNLTNSVGNANLPYIYSQTYALTSADAETVIPTAPTSSDFLLFNSETSTGSLYAYEVNTSTIGSSNTFSRSSSSSGFYYLNDYGYDYEDLFEYNNFGTYMDANIFNIVEEEDGSYYYTPTLDNLQYIAGNCFMAQIDYYSQISGGYITDVRVYVEYSETYQSYYIDEIVVEYNQNNYSYSGQVVFNYYDFDSSAPDFSFEVDS